MNIWAVLVFLSSILYIYVSFLWTSSNQPLIYFDATSLFIVVVGTIIAVTLSVDIRRLFKLFMVFIRRFFFGKNYEFRTLIMEVMTLTESFRKGESLSGLIPGISDDFLQESVQTIDDGILEGQDLIELLESRNENELLNNEKEANLFQTMSKFPPAFGMIGTTMGMVALLANLATSDDAIGTIGPMMAVALITTLYGAILANLILLPIAENLKGDSEEIYEKNIIIIEGVKLLLKKTNPVVVAEKMNSFLPKSKRLDWKEVINS